ncbi:hypothetical protein K457DRAFT_571723 [Linnemannia elongata AG-77]|uniref:Uncharacterized protein n=1 Tax=Linnemannia elongata AG-77 TaxID=1314771 RepID=A0A197KF77_9FUNG|nr:hypothetical protein K457DRAFT_571723 [Linnemannia elongata AG-77]
MNLPSPDEQLDMHGPRAKLPFEQIPPQSRAGVKSSHESIEQDRALIGSNGIITSGGTSSNEPSAPGDHQASLVSPGPASFNSLSGQKRPDHRGGGPQDSSSSVFEEDALGKEKVLDQEEQHQHQQQTNKKDTNQSTSLWSRFAWPWSRSDLDQQPTAHGDHPSSSLPHHTTSSITPTPPQMHQRTYSSASSNSPHDTTHNQNRPLNTQVNTNPLGFGTFASASAATDRDQHQPKQTRFQSLSTSFKRFLGFVGPGYSKSSVLVDSILTTSTHTLFPVFVVCAPPFLVFSLAFTILSSIHNCHSSIHPLPPPFPSSFPTFPTFTSPNLQLPHFPAGV